MDNQYYIVMNNKECGPYAWEILVQMAHDGIITADTLLLDPELHDYVRIQSYPAFENVEFIKVPVVAAAPVHIKKSTTEVGVSAESSLGFVLSLLGLICLAILQVLPFEIEIQSRGWALYSSIEHDLNMYRLWFGGLVVGCCLVVIGLVLLIGGLVKNHNYSDMIAIMGLIFCIISFALAGYSFANFQKMNDSYATLQLAKEDSISYEYKRYLEDSRAMKKHSDSIKDVTAEIDSILS